MRVGMLTTFHIICLFDKQSIFRIMHYLQHPVLLLIWPKNDLFHPKTCSFFLIYFQLSRQKKELQSYCEEKDDAVLDREMFINRIKHLEGELETQRNTFNDRTRDIRSMEARVPASGCF